MAKILNPILVRDPLESTAHRLHSMFQPIQKTKHKKSDYVAYVGTPLLDYFVLDAIFAIDVSIRLVNALASLLKAAYVWTLNQQKSDSLIDKETSRELDEFSENVSHIGSAIIAQFMNILLSTVSLVTRPIASIVELVSEDSSPSMSFAR
ncbi:hypothetical protein [Legionella sp. km772]|uniref:hypothetical protein n=1 Tax=Legionella sp. km772 TaxID=2498111 RepID=UPI000F8EF644|nr:hypothetical protein [Legionella sp. km772]RUR06396.1 hypothetical protein ELY15_13250 [Legionella sp. km772]